VRNAAPAVEREARSGDRVETGGRHVRHALPRLVGASKRGRADFGIHVLEQRARHRDRHSLGERAPGRELELEASRDLIVEPAPGGEARHAEVRGEPLELGRERPRRRFTQAPERVLRAREPWISEQCREQGVVRVAERGAHRGQRHLEVRATCGVSRALALDRFVAGVRRGETAEVGAQMCAARRRGFDLEQDLRKALQLAASDRHERLHAGR
jgi:hypothetical protein